MQDDKTQAQGFEQERAPWVEPAVSRLEAGSAELLSGRIFDNSDES
jgi:hypothetical protein